MSLPFKSLLPMDGHLLMLDYEPVLPVCTPSGDETSESTSESTSDSQQDGGESD